MQSLKNAHDFIVQLISKLENEIDKCKKARGPNMKKMKERTTILGAKVDYARTLKAKISEISTALGKGQVSGPQINSLKEHLTEYMANSDDQTPP